MNRLLCSFLRLPFLARIQSYRAKPVRISKRVFSVASLALALVVVGHAAADQRPPLTAASAVRVGNYGAPSVTVSGQHARQIVGELNALRRKDWRKGEARLSCYATLVILKGARSAGLFRIGPDHVVERTVEKGQSSYSLLLVDADMPEIKKLLAEILPPKCE